MYVFVNMYQAGVCTRKKIIGKQKTSATKHYLIGDTPFVTLSSESVPHPTPIPFRWWFVLWKTHTCSGDGVIPKVKRSKRARAIYTRQQRSAECFRSLERNKQQQKYHFNKRTEAKPFCFALAWESGYALYSFAPF